MLLGACRQEQLVLGDYYLLSTVRLANLTCLVAAAFCCFLLMSLNPLAARLITLTMLFT